MVKQSVKYINPLGESVLFSAQNNLPKTTPYVLESISGIGIPKIEPEYTEVPGEDGAALTGQYVGPRTISLKFSVSADNLPDAYLARQKLIHTVCGATGAGTLVYTNASGRAYEIKCLATETSGFEKRINNTMKTAELQFWCPWPYFKLAGSDITLAGNGWSDWQRMDVTDSNYTNNEVHCLYKKISVQSDVKTFLNVSFAENSAEVYAPQSVWVFDANQPTPWESEVTYMIYHNPAGIPGGGGYTSTCTQWIFKQKDVMEGEPYDFTDFTPGRYEMITNGPLASFPRSESTYGDRIILKRTAHHGVHIKRDLDGISVKNDSGGNAFGDLSPKTTFIRLLRGEYTIAIPTAYDPSFAFDDHALSVSYADYILGV